MNRYQQAFRAAKESGRIALVPFAVAGDPGLRASEEVFRTYLGAGADVLEIGYPFSDPMADGPVNQRAAQRAIEAGITPSRFFAMLARLRKTTEAPFGLLLYANTVHHLGHDEFCARAAGAGVDSILVADLPPEEADPMLAALQRHGLDSVFIVSELTPAQRTRRICRLTTGFVYVVSRLGTTGVQQSLSHSVRGTLGRLRRATRLPLCVGFGLSTPEHVRKVKSAGADGAIVGSALVKIIEQHASSRRAMVSALDKAVRELRKATETGGRKARAA